MDFQLLFYFGMWQQVTCFFAFLGLMSIWYHIGRKKGDFGQVWLALSILCWSISGIVDSKYGGAMQYHLNCQPSLTDSNVFYESQLIQLNGWKSILSLCNSLFILLALPWFKYLPIVLEQVIKSKYWPIIVGIPFLFSLLSTIRKFYSNSSISLISELDVYYSILTLLVLGIVLWESFTKRRLVLLAVLSAVCILITFAAQVFKLTDDGNTQVLFSAIFKTALIMIFFALALSWVKDLTERIQIKSGNIFLKLSKIKNGRSFNSMLAITGLTGQKSKEISLTNKNYELLKLFMDRKIGPSEGWLEIKPKSNNRTGILYDINDHNEIKRLIHSILDGVYGRNLWSKTEHELPLKEAFLEMSSVKERMIRLAIPKENLDN
ncbi:MAG: hypothetical protein ACJATI_002410 [Halioglobus sp.]|jgi:hypothetical protein